MTHTLLIEPSELKAFLGNPDWVIIDCRFQLSDTEAGRKAYLEGHIPGAYYAHLDEDLSGKVEKGKTGRHPLPEIEAITAVFSGWGISAQTQVVAYDDMGGAMAARVWSLLRWLGHEAVAVLNGGWPRWAASGGASSTAIPELKKGDFIPRLNPDIWVDAHGVERVLSDPEYLIIDSRAPERYRGEVEPIDPVAGHIPGAANVAHFSNVGPDGAFLPPKALREKFSALLGGREPGHCIFYCGSGVTAAHNAMAMEWAGLPGAKIYAGSWSEWITDPDRGVETGDPRS
ncbi:MAG: sulfurtransferase [Haliscomenobacter sp.]|nr:sulfurtransferase [Haliscomenobacter sp.]